MKKYKSIDELIKVLKSEVESINNVITVLQAPPLNFNEEIIFKYIETRSTVKTADFVRSKGLKTERSTVFNPAEISKLITEAPKDISPALLLVAQDIFVKNKKSVMRRHG